MVAGLSDCESSIQTPNLIENPRPTRYHALSQLLVSLEAKMRGRGLVSARCAFILMLLAIAPPAWAQMSLKTVVSSGLSQPLYVTAPPGDHNRLFIVEKTGAIRIFNKQTNTLLTNPYLTVPVNSSGERGLLGLAFDPDFATNGRFYINYTRTGTAAEVGDIIVARYTASGNPMISNTA